MCRSFTPVTDLDIRMTSHTPQPPAIERPEWLAVLSRASTAQLEIMAGYVHGLPSIQQVRPAEVGMVMLRGRIGGTGNPFNLGEATVVRCAVRLGDGPLGVGYVLGRDKRRAELVAMFDALLQDPLHHAALQRTLVAPLAEGQLQDRAHRQQAMAQSKVEFFTFVRGEA